MVEDLIVAQPADVKGFLREYNSPEALSEPNLVYPPMAARGELVRMVAALGGLKLTETTVPMGGADPAMLAACGTPSGLPILTHGKVKLAQSLAIESYISSIAPK